MLVSKLFCLVSAPFMVQGMRHLLQTSLPGPDGISVPFNDRILDAKHMKFVPHTEEGFGSWVGLNLDYWALQPTFDFVNQLYGPLLNRGEAVRIFFQL
jgi:hypothetical protein